MAGNVYASQLELDQNIEGNEKLVSTDGDGKTRNIKVDGLAAFISKQAVDSVSGKIDANAEAIKKSGEDISALGEKDAALEAKDSELEAAISANKEELNGKIGDLQEALAKVSEKADDTTETDALNKRIADLEEKHKKEVEDLVAQHDKDVEALVAAHNPWESFGI